MGTYKIIYTRIDMMLESARIREKNKMGRTAINTDHAVNRVVLEYKAKPAYSKFTCKNALYAKMYTAINASDNMESSNFRMHI